LHCTDF